MKIKKIIFAITAIGTLALSNQVLADDTPTTDDGNRYNRDRQYNSEISAADAYQKMMKNEVLLLDVRSRQEYAAGHPDRAHNIPYPRIDSGHAAQTPTKFYEEALKAAKGNLDQPILTLCRTGSRSIDAANILADPLNTANDPRRSAVDDPDAKPFTNVRNIWEGFVGRELFAFESGVPNPTIPLDLNNDGFINDDTADVYAHTTDANPDKDGWRNFQNLPWSTNIRKPEAYLQDSKQYECWQTDLGC
jgi:rhodanese-related sulfurtransferase